LYILKNDDFEIQNLSSAVKDVKEGVNYCSICHTMADNTICSVCGDSSRDKSIICVVEEPLDAQALDKIGSFKGVFHVLGGVLNPMEGIGPEKLNMDSLTKRISESSISEIIIATNPTLEGETTAAYIAKLLKPSSITITRIARGLPMGGDLEYADEITLSRALQGRQEMPQ